jgi:membrane fusion protein
MVVVLPDKMSVAPHRKVQYQERRTTIKNRFRSIQQEQEHLEEEIEINQRRLALVKATLEQYQKLGAEGYLSTAQVQAKQDESLDMAARLSASKRARQQLAENKEAAQAELTALSLSEVNDLSLLERTSASLEQEKAENRNRRSVQIVAPQSGRLAVLLVQEGQAVIAGQPLASLIPVSTCGSRSGAEACSDKQAESVPSPGDREVLEANLYIPSRSAGFVEKGQSVMIRYHAFPYQKYGLHRGEIVDVSAVPLTPSDIPQAQATTIWGLVQQLDPSGAQAPALYKVRVRLNEQVISTAKGDTALKAGLTLEADITLDERKVWEWVLEPMLAVSRRRAS